MSDRDIGAGQTWDVEIEAALKRARFGVVCLTPSNVASTYLHYEAGAIANQVASVNRVCPLLLGFNHPSQLGQPLGRFQAKLATRGGVWDLVAAINRAVERPLDETVLRGAFEGQWDKLAADIDRIQSPAELREPQRRSTDDILNEILEHVRQLVAGQLGTVQRDVLRAIKDANPRHLLFALDALGPDVRRALKVLGTDAASKLFHSDPIAFRDQIHRLAEDQRARDQIASEDQQEIAEPGENQPRGLENV
jgi:hypothetical protein